MPLGPRERVRAILLVKGGEMRGRMVTAPRSHLTQEGRAILVTAKA